jgi:FtsP/CotA-like multicopper oxidase with cupredoxin domain
VHWHGIRIDNAMDGVPGLTQAPVPPGGRFDYDFALPDAGTYWYHAHVTSMEQVGRGLAGPLIVTEPEPPEVDGEEVLMLDDWLLDPETAQFVTPFAQPMMLSHAGRIGNLVGVNGAFAPRLEARRGARLRLRLINAANARIFRLRLQGLAGWTVALDGMPLAEPQRLEELLLAPAQRADVIVDVEAEAAAPAGLLMHAGSGGWQALVEMDVTPGTAPRRTPPAALPPNPRSAPPDLAQAQRLEMVMAGGAMAGLPQARHAGALLDGRALAQRGLFWALAGEAGRPEAPFARLPLGSTARLRFDNRTAFAHGMHLHGMHFRALGPDGAMGPLRDTLLSQPRTATEVVFRADNPGKWLLHCHMLGHAAAGMTSWIEVA